MQLNLSRIPPARVEPSYVNPEPGRLQFPNGEQFEFKAADLVAEECIGTGTYGGIVTKMVHTSSEQVMAVKRVRAQEVDTKERQKLLRELRIIIESQCCEDIVRFYGALFQDGDCWICMELMDCSLDNFYPLVYARGEQIPQRVIGFITASVVRALNYLKDMLNIIHRDVKPSNILLDCKGFVKLCDFGISGYLVDSIARTQDVGCQIYLAPERLTDGKGYDIRSDVWSLGLTLVEICNGYFPYVWKSIFDQVEAVVKGDPPFLTSNVGRSYELVDFINQCLIKDMEQRPKFRQLMTHPFFQRYNLTGPKELEEERNYIGQYVHTYLKQQESANERISGSRGTEEEIGT